MGDVKRFDIAKMKQNTVITLLGRRGTGKTTLVKELLYQHHDLPVGCVINGTEEANNVYGDIVPTMLVKNEYKPKHVSDLIERQRIAIKKQKQDQSDPRAFLIMEDIMIEKWVKDPEMRRIFLNGRNYKITFMLTMQYPLDIPPSLSSQVDYVFIFEEPSYGSKKRIYQKYANRFPSFEVFSQVLDNFTRDYGCLVIDNTRADADIWETVYWYRARAPSSLRECVDHAGHLAA